MKRLNNWIADKLAIVMATMWLFWIILILCIASYVVQPPSTAQGQILFWVSILFQGAALPVLAFVSNKQGDRTSELLQDTHEKVLAELAEVKELHAQADSRHKQLIDALHAIVPIERRVPK